MINSESLKENREQEENNLIFNLKTSDDKNEKSISKSNNSKKLEDQTIPQILSNFMNELKYEFKSGKEEILNEKLQILEEENRKLLRTLYLNLEKYSQETKQREEDLEFWKKAYKEQKILFSNENQKLSSSLNETTLQFILLREMICKKKL
jgi:hypothetical protein